MALGSTQPLTEMSTRNLPVVKGGWLVKLRTSPPSVSLDVSQLYGPSRPVTEIALPYLYLCLEDIRGSEVIFIFLGHGTATLSSGKSPRCPLDRRLGGSQGRSGRCGGEKQLSCAGNLTRVVQPVACRYTA
jgi:hypothetical protein